MKLLISLLVAIGFALPQVNRVEAQSKLKAPNFTLKTAEGKVYELSKLKGKVVIVNFWATWCGPCRVEIPDFIEVYKKHKDKGVEIIGISVDEDGWDVVRPFIKKNGINYPIVMQDERVSRDYGGISAIPTTFIVDKEGYVVFGRAGVLTKAQLESRLKPLL
jgi:cytochrome c biogenesis protein CcmG/thiol:disulfide interchange protein DsbE